MPPTPRANRSHAAHGTPKVNNLADTKGVGGVGTLLTNNPNKDAANNQVNPQRLDPATVNGILTCDQDHSYNDEQKAFDGGAMDKFVTTVGNASGKSGPGQPCSADDVMNYYDGNTVTALWNYAQQYSMSDNYFASTFGPSAPGAINLVSGDTGNVGLQINGAATDGDTVSDGKGGFSLIEDAQPYYDDCSTRDAVSLTGANVGDELNAAGLSWGWFQGGFKPTTSFAVATASSPQPTSTFTPDEFKGKFATAPASDQGLCNAVHPIGAAVGGTGGTVAGPTNYGNKDDYIAHHEPFQYYASTANPHHLAPASLAAIGTDTQTVTAGVPQFDTANHQYDTSDFDSLVGAISHGYLSADHLPAVSFLKAPGYQDGHAGYSDPIDEQKFVVERDQCTPAHSRLVEHGSCRDLRRLRRVLRPRLQRHSQHVEHGVGCQPARAAGLPHRYRPVRGHGGQPAARWPERALRLRSADAAAGDLSLGEAELGRSLADRHELDTEVRRDQLEPAAHHRLLLQPSPGHLANLFDFHSHPRDDWLFLLDPITGQPLESQRR